ncbi:MAG TPA: hypothetical protein VFP59_06980 [Candidatus Angelobacter sp.]|nr:hypothetical protein [Candidatus Angelobacter sp.]
MAHFSAGQDDRLLWELNLHEEQLNAWLNSSPAHAALFIEDPVGALRRAGLGIPESVLQELEKTMDTLAQKLRAI